MKKLFVLMCVTSSLLVACGKKDEGDKKNPKDELVDTTDISSCVGMPPNGISIMNRTWRSIMVSQSGFLVESRLNLTANTMTARALCSQGGAGVQAQATSKVTISGSTVEIMESSHQMIPFRTQDGTDVACVAEINQTDPFFYVFQGPCLKIQNGPFKGIYPSI